jgi:alpha-tubulin suppressor-like RCC1 family protein
MSQNRHGSARGRARSAADRERTHGSGAPSADTSTFSFTHGTMPNARRYAAGACALAITLLWGCANDATPPTEPPPPPPPAVATVVISPAAPQLIVGTTATLAATPRDAGGTALTRTVTWRSENATIASVSSSGVVTAVAVGSTTIVATSDAVSGTVGVTVVPVPVASVAISAAETGVLVPSQTRAFTVAVRDSVGGALVGRTTIWRSSNDSVATVSADGGLTARAPGVAFIAATAEGRGDSVSVTVVEGGFVTAAAGGTVRTVNGAFALTVPAGAVTAGVALRVAPVTTPPVDARLVPGSAFALAPDSVLFAQPAQLSLQYAAPLGAALPRQFRVHRWTGTAWSLLESTVDTATRRVSAAAARAGLYALLEVPRPVASVTVSPTSASLRRDSTQQLRATVRAADGAELSDRVVTWRSSNPAIATVSASGLVTAVSGGGPIIVTAESEGQQGTAEITVTVPFRFASLFAGPFVTCGLTEVGEAWCWGSNGDCELGVSPCASTQASAVRVATALRFVQMAPADEFTCGLATTGAAYCWGSDANGVLGNGSAGSSAVPSAVVDGHVFQSLRTTRTHVCGLREDGQSWCWGRNLVGQLGDSDDPRSATRPVQTRGGLQFVQLEVGYEHTCGLTAAGQAWCWGENSDGESGDGSGTDRFAPVAVAGGHVFTRLSLGDYHSCGLTAAGAVWCWGWNREGQIGDGSRTSRLTPTRVAGADVFASVHAFGWSTCGLLVSGEAKCWGENAEGQLGDGTTTDRLVPTATLGAFRFRTLTSGGGYHMCGEAQGAIWHCWGWNVYGQIGDGTLIDRRSPVVLPLPGAAATAAARVWQAHGLRGETPSARGARRKPQPR